MSGQYIPAEEAARRLLSRAMENNKGKDKSFTELSTECVRLIGERNGLATENTQLRARVAELEAERANVRARALEEAAEFLDRKAAEHKLTCQRHKLTVGARNLFLNRAAELETDAVAIRALKGANHGG